MLKNERLIMSNYFRNIFIGTLVIFIDINIGFIDIVPDFIGYIFIINALINIYKETKISEFKYAYYLSFASFIFSILGYIYPMNYNLESYIPSFNLSLIYLSLAVNVVYLFLMYTGIIYLIENTELDVYTYKNRKGVAIIIGLTQLLTTALIPIIQVDVIMFVTIILVILLFIVNISFLMTLNDLKKMYLVTD